MAASDRRTQTDYLVLAVIPVGIALNVGLGAVVIALRLPIYLDAVGTILVTALMGWRAGIAAGVMSFLLAAVLVSPTYVYFVGTQAAIAVYVYVVCTRLGVLKSVWRVVVAGVGLGIVAGLVSAPVIVLVFGGASGSGRDLLTALLVSSGQQVLKAVALSGAASEPIDKTLQLMLAWSLLRSLPQRVLDRFPNRIGRSGV